MSNPNPTSEYTEQVWETVKETIKNECHLIWLDIEKEKTKIYNSKDFKEKEPTYEVLVELQEKIKRREDEVK